MEDPVTVGTTVRVRDQDKEKLERLRALATLYSGSKVTRERLLRFLLDEALSHTESFLARAFALKLPLSEEEFQKIMELVSDWGVETSSEDIESRPLQRASKVWGPGIPTGHCWDVKRSWHSDNSNKPTLSARPVPI